MSYERAVLCTLYLRLEAQYNCFAFLRTKKACNLNNKGNLKSTPKTAHVPPTPKLVSASEHIETNPLKKYLNFIFTLCSRHKEKQAIFYYLCIRFKLLELSTFNKVCRYLSQCKIPYVPLFMQKFYVSQ